jgi:CHASE3 domain sensor protein
MTSKGAKIFGAIIVLAIIVGVVVYYGLASYTMLNGV